MIPKRSSSMYNVTDFLAAPESCQPKELQAGVRELSQTATNSACPARGSFVTQLPGAMVGAQPLQRVQRHLAGISHRCWSLAATTKSTRRGSHNLVSIRTSKQLTGLLVQRDSFCGIRLFLT